MQEYLKVLKEEKWAIIIYIVIEGFGRRRKNTARDVVVETREQLGIRNMIFYPWKAGRYAACQRKTKKSGAGWQYPIGRRRSDYR